MLLARIVAYAMITAPIPRANIARQSNDTFDFEHKESSDAGQSEQGRCRISFARSCDKTNGWANRRMLVAVDSLCLKARSVL